MTHEEELQRFREKFPSQRIWVRDSDDLQNISLVESYLREALTRAEERGQQNPKVGFLRQYLNENPNPLGPWTDEQILNFIRIPFSSENLNG